MTNSRYDESTPRVGTSRRAFLRLLGLAAAGGSALVAACTQPSQPAATAKPAATTAPTAAAAKPTEAAKPAAQPTAASQPAAAPATQAAKPGAAAVDLNAIEAAAKREGKVTVYSSFNLDEFDKVFPLFEKRYPDVKVDHVRASGEKLVQRMVTEIKGGKVLADVLETNSFDIYNVLQEKYFEPWTPPNAAAMPDTLKDKDGLWVATRQNIDCIAWNTDLVKADEAPKSYDDLAHPKWSGKIMVEADDMEMFAGLVGGKFGGDVAKASEWLQRVGANKPEPHKGHTETTELLAAGQGAIFFGAYAHRIESLKKKKAPIEWMQTEAVQLIQAGGLIKGAPHPNAAKLFWNWLLGEEGQEAISKIGRVPARPGVKLEAPLLPAGMKAYPAQPAMAAQYENITKIWKDSLGLR